MDPKRAGREEGSGSLYQSFFNALVASDPCSAPSATFISLAYSSCPMMAVQFTVCLSVWETFTER